MDILMCCSYFLVVNNEFIIYNLTVLFNLQVNVLKELWTFEVIHMVLILTSLFDQYLFV